MGDTIYVDTPDSVMPGCGSVRVAHVYRLVDGLVTEVDEIQVWRPGWRPKR